LAGAISLGKDVFKPNGVTRVAQGQQRLDPSRRSPQHPLRGMPRIERCVINGDAVGVAKLRASQQRAGVNVGLDLADFHACRLSYRTDVSHHASTLR